MAFLVYDVHFSSSKQRFTYCKESVVFTNIVTLDLKLHIIKYDVTEWGAILSACNMAVLCGGNTSAINRCCHDRPEITLKLTLT